MSSDTVLYLALELSHTTWKLAFASGRGRSIRRREVAARDIPALMREIREARRKLRLAPDAAVMSCYEAGRDGFWLHRCLAEQQVQNLVIDSSSIEVNRRSRRAKSDGLDAEKLLNLLLRHAAGESRVFSIVQVPTPEEEDARQLHRELQTLKHESTRHINRLKGLLASLGLVLAIDKHFPQRLSELRQWNGQPVPSGLAQRLLHEFERLAVVNRQIRELARRRSQTIKRQSSPQIEQVRKLLGLRAIGVNGAWLLVQELFGWRTFRNRKQLGSLGADADAICQRSVRPGARDPQGRQSAGAVDDGRTGLELAALPARERVESLVLRAVRPGQQSAAADRHRRPGPQAVGGIVEIPPDGRTADGSRAIRLENRDQ